jgi:hypothetical protein
MPRSPRPFSSGRYGQTDPLRRLFGLRLLAEPLPAPIALMLLRAWMIPGRYNGNQAIQSAGARASVVSENAGTQFPQAPAAAGAPRLRLPEDVLLFLPAWRLDTITRIELEVGRRIVEIPRTEITRETRNHLLREQGMYLAHLYHALVAQLGEATAQAVFTQRVLAM